MAGIRLKIYRQASKSKRFVLSRYIASTRTLSPSFRVKEMKTNPIKRREKEKQKGICKKERNSKKKDHNRKVRFPPTYRRFSLLLLSLVIVIFFFCIFHAGFHRVYKSARLK